MNGINAVTRLGVVVDCSLDVARQPLTRAAYTMVERVEGDDDHVAMTQRADLTPGLSERAIVQVHAG